MQNGYILFIIGNLCVKTMVQASRLFVAETKAHILGKSSNRLIRSGSTLKLSCRVYLGRKGPDAHYRDTAVIHWFHDQRLLDPELEKWQLQQYHNQTLANGHQQHSSYAGRA